MQNYVILEKSTSVQVFLAVTRWILTRQVKNNLENMYLCHEAQEL